MDSAVKAASVVRFPVRTPSVFVASFLIAGVIRRWARWPGGGA